MARSKSRNRSAHRDPSPIARPRLVARPSTVYGDLLRSIEDRRSFHPEGDYRPARVFSGRTGFVKSDPVSRGSKKQSKFLTAHLPVERFSFVASQKVLVCVRRSMRREVLHALKLTRSGRGKSRRRNYQTMVRC